MSGVRIAFLLVLCSCVCVCYSSETNRRRRGGPGADVGNRGPVVNMHEVSRLFYKLLAYSGQASASRCRQSGDELSRK